MINYTKDKFTLIRGNKKTGKTSIFLLSSLLVFLFSGTMLFNVFSSSAYIENVPIISQLPELPTGCEVTALAMLLNYNGIDVSKITLAKDMPKTQLQSTDSGDYAEHPSVAFLGDPFTENGYGVYSPVILNMIDNYAPGRAVDLNGKSLNQLLKVVANGMPVLAWATIDMKPVTLTDKWITPDGEEFTWTAGEHALIIVGYENNEIIVHDPLEGKEIRYDKKLFKKRYNKIGKMAVTMQ